MRNWREPQNLYEQVKGFRPFRERGNTDRCVKSLWIRNCPATLGYITGRVPTRTK